ncbi:MAG: molybdopterin molybdotransferase MoeA [Armatimonadetes bacterium]|nr:molybdopterin molybdotransferase MoeA [Armatimonadota bacterium]
MISFDDALRIVLESCGVLGSEDVAVSNCAGRHLAEDVTSTISLPIFDNSAVDGFAIHAEDVARGCKQLKVLGTIFAGDDPAVFVLEQGTTIRVMTGAGIPSGTSAVVMQEDVQHDGEVAVLNSVDVSERANIRRAGEEIRPGDTVLSAGLCCNPATAAALATLGRTTVTVHKRPSVGIMVTGAELVQPGGELQPGQIFESNSIGLAAAVRAHGINDVVVETVGDGVSETVAAFQRLAKQCDIVVSSGGVSVGERDLVRNVYLEHGVKELFWKVAMKPGKPVFFGKSSACLVFGLPGNPVSALVTFETLVTPAIRKMSGSLHPVAPRTRITLTKHIRRKPGRLEFVRATTEYRDGKPFATPLDRQGSHMTSGLALADRLLIVPLDAECIEAGTELDSMTIGSGGSR